MNWFSIGPDGNYEVCETCSLSFEHCPGHMGNIPLPMPVYNPITFDTMYKVRLPSNDSYNY